MAVASVLAHKSALARAHLPLVSRVLEAHARSGLIVTCAVVEFEMLWSARSPREFDELRSDRRKLFESLPIEHNDWDRVLDVQQRLWRTGSMRKVSLSDLLIAAVAERHRIAVLHYDADFDLIANITGQKMEWVVPRGSVP